MFNFSSFFVCLALSASIVVATLNADAQSTSGLTSESGSPLSARIVTDSGKVFNLTLRNDRFQRVGLTPGQITNISLTFPSSMAGQIISAAPLDGGSVTLANQGAIAADGSVSLTFKAGSPVGVYRVLLSQGDSVQILQFWVKDLNNTQNNPPVYPGS